VSPKRKGIPELRRHKTHKCGVVRLSGRDYYLGVWGDAYYAQHGKGHPPPEVREAYDRKIAEWLAAGRQGPDPGASITCSQLAARYLAGVLAEYQGDTQASELKILRRALAFLVEAYGDTPARDYGPVEFKATRERMAKAKLKRSTVAHYTSRIKAAFRWASESELLPITVYQTLAAVRGLKAGRSGARESVKVPPAPEASLEAVLAVLREPFPTMVRLQRLTGMRPGEVCRLRLEEIDRARTPWEWRPAKHKTAHRGKRRVVFFGPQARQLLAETYARRENGPVFFGKNGRHYRAGYYWKVLIKACDRAGVPRFRPNQLRHSAGTDARKHGGLDAAQVVLGHETMDTTQLYAEKQEDLARKVVEEIG
jgi:integrase